jgi:hypothetical protein
MSSAWANFEWQNRQPGEPIDIAYATMWVADGPDFRCRACKRDCCGAYEVEVKWGDTTCTETIAEVCSRCMRKLASQSRNAQDREYM